MISVADYGALPNTPGADAGINAAIRAAILMKASTVLIPDGTYLTDDVIHLGDGHPSAQFSHVSLVGSPGAPYIDGVCIKPSFYDRPVINIQGSRGGRVSGIRIEGPNGNPSGPFPQANPDAYAGLGVRDANRYFCGISIDAYSGSRPAQSYPDANYPVSASQWSKAHSSRVSIERCVFRRLPCAVTTKPSNGLNADQNADFVTVRDSIAEYCEYGVLFNGSQTRLNLIDNCCLVACRVGVGGGILGIPTTQDCEITNTCFDLSAIAVQCPAFGWAHHWTLDHCYAEQLGAIADMSGNQSRPTLVVRDSQFSFVAGDASVTQYYPYHLRAKLCTTRLQSVRLSVNQSSSTTRVPYTIVTGTAADSIHLSDLKAAHNLQPIGRHAEMMAQIGPLQAVSTTSGSRTVQTADDVYSMWFASGWPKKCQFNHGKRELFVGAAPTINGRTISGTCIWVIGANVSLGSYLCVTDASNGRTLWLKVTAWSGSPSWQCTMEGLSQCTDSAFSDETLVQQMLTGYQARMIVEVLA